MRMYDAPTLTIKRGRTEKRRLDTAKMLVIARDLAALDPVACYFEDTQGLPGQSAPAAHAFGQTCGLMEACMWSVGIPVIMVHPAVWKSGLKCPAGKDGARALASRVLPAGAGLWPLKKHDGRAEAALIALWGSKFGTLR